MDDSRIVDLFLERDQRAIEQAKQKYSSPLRSIALGITGNPQDAEECENDAYLGAWHAIPPHEPRQYLFAFLARIVRHAALDICRRSARYKRGAVIIELSNEIEQCLPAPNDTPCRVDSGELAHAISVFLREQNAEACAVFVRRYWFCDSIAVIAGRFSMSESKVKSMLMRTRGNLKKYLIKEGYEL